MTGQLKTLEDRITEWKTCVGYYHPTAAIMTFDVKANEIIHELIAERNELAGKLEEIANRHIQEMPDSRSGQSEIQWIRENYDEVRRIARSFISRTSTKAE